MYRSNDAVSGSPGGHFTTIKGNDGRYRVKCDGLPNQEFVATNERDAFNAAQRAYQDAVIKGDIGSSI